MTDFTGASKRRFDGQALGLRPRCQKRVIPHLEHLNHSATEPVFGSSTLQSGQSRLAAIERAQWSSIQWAIR
jgi:hypothetical protein